MTTEQIWNYRQVYAWRPISDPTGYCVVQIIFVHSILQGELVTGLRGSVGISSVNGNPALTRRLVIRLPTIEIAHKFYSSVE